MKGFNIPSLFMFDCAAAGEFSWMLVVMLCYVVLCCACLLEMSFGTLNLFQSFIVDCVVSRLGFTGHCFKLIVVILGSCAIFDGLTDGLTHLWE